jgi:hypothetical protein
LIRVYQKALFALISFMIVVFASPKMALLLPAMDRSTIGFDITDEERGKFDAKIIKAMKKGYKAEILTFTDKNKFVASAEHCVAVFIIEYFYIGSDVDVPAPGHIGHIAVRVHMFPDKQKNKSEVIALKATAEPDLGRNRPFEFALKGTFERIESRNYYHSPQFDTISSLDDVLNLRDAFPCSSTVLLLAPDLDSAAMLYEMLPEEKHDFSCQAADLLSQLTHFKVRIVAAIDLPAYHECYKMSAEIKFSRALQTITLNLTNGFNAARSFGDTNKAKNADDWNENKEFTKDIFRAFKQFRKNYQGK